MNTPRSYAEAGVDVAAGERAVELMKAAVSRAQRAETVGGIGGFAGLFDASALKGYDKPLLATATDGVGTKVAVAQALGKHDTIGQDLVAMVVDDLVVSGAEPLFMTDYIACGKVHPEVIAQIVSGIAYGCELAGCALLGGETAEHPGLLGPDEYDVAGAGTAVVEADQLLGPHRVQPGDRLIAMASSGLHSNGYSLARAVLLGPDGPGLSARLPELDRSVGMELLEPTRIYAQVCLALARAQLVSGFAHVTGGGIAANLARVLPEGLTAVVERSAWRPAGVFAVIARLGQIQELEMETAFNMGIGMIAVLPQENVDAALQVLADAEVPAWELGTVRDRASADVSDAPAKGGKGGIVNVVGRYQ